MQIKRTAVALATILYLLVLSPATATIRNSYENEIETARISYDAIGRLITNKQLTAKQFRNLNHRLKELREFIVLYEVSERLIGQLKIISPSIFQQLDTLQDSKGRKVDVYIKCVRPYSTKAKAAGVTFIGQAESDPTRYTSAFGDDTVLVQLWVTDNVLFVLAHALGHAKYQVTNLSDYIVFYRDTYRTKINNDYIGHHPHDQSGQASDLMEEDFRKDYVLFRQKGGKVENLALLYFDAKQVF